ncbi:hypothetical protein BI364_09835 [Acidihalobacter yilgarnensis]|uniref:Cytoskeleton protein RodZ-like C-terminal domain-containing protein n=1 Tax=Acidihalobacter yilgarnensis TaxID=2819280 RepID=A0A1D8IP24_9GAMM|nr:RodZ domain-containing protein [Acidihalobacter yilgarnensis]AOU98216.1 hypothetical protein BI364_09835 [Acidihalobacter yilgarnensis]
MDDDRAQPLPETDVSPEPIGRQLQLRREAMGLRLEDAAKHLHLDVNVLRELEADNFEALPGPAYIKGYLRAYGQLLELDTRALIDSYQALAHPTEPLLRSATDMTDHMALRGRIYAFGSAAALVLILVAAWWYTHLQTTAARTVAAVEQPSVPESKTSILPAMGHSGTLALPVLSTLRTPIAASIPSVAASQTDVAIVPAVSLPAVEAPKQSPTRSTAAVQAAGLSQLRLNLTHRSWVQIDDANGKQLVYGLLDTGTQRLLTGAAPFSIFLGYAQGVQLSIDGHAIDIAPHIRANHTARFEVSAPSSDAGTKTSP